ncbi:glycoside hydrolase family 68 protein [Salinimonas lutimaris]|uniref:glycoside hydrolase family 68 protein n=1 Tax=Salinimonas lutimaris TaxID=914153 RepID=UPI0010C10A6C|nr:glycoside hydrolase family 68 protein [Salinimonas lutimaris]
MKKKRPLRSLSLSIAVALGLGAVSSVQAASSDNPRKQASYPVWADYTDSWTRQDAATIALTDDNTLPLLDEMPTEIITDEVWIWDTWPMTNLNARTVNYKGYKVIFSLTADRDLAFPQRHWTAEIGYSVSRDGESWEYQGDVFPEDVDPPGLREWAGSTILIGDKVYFYYTASGSDGAGPNDPEYFTQKLVVASATISADSNGVSFSDWSEHKIIAEADGEMYQTLEQSAAGPIIYGFRDPWVFENPQDGQVYMLFEGNSPGETVECGAVDDSDNTGPINTGPYRTADVATAADGELPVSPQAKYYNGNIGLASSVQGSMTEFELLPPILHANCTNQQLERPHATFSGGLVYLWTISHKFTFAPALQDVGVDGLYGFVGPSIRSDYLPLNGHGLVLANPPENNTQAYSWYAMPGGFVEAFLDNVNGEFAGTLTPTVKMVTKKHTETSFVHTFDGPFIP